MNSQPAGPHKFKPKIEQAYIDEKGNRQRRGDNRFLLPSLHINRFYEVPGFEDDKQTQEWLGAARSHYEYGEYDRALDYLDSSLKRNPALKSLLFYYLRVCKRVVGTPLTDGEEEYEIHLRRYQSRPKWLKWTMYDFEYKVRCKHCGRYTQYMHPDHKGFVFDLNKCSSCDRMYPMPSWMWDSPEGRAHSYFGLSFKIKDPFYAEFEDDYDPVPKMEWKSNQRPPLPDEGISPGKGW